MSRKLSQQECVRVSQHRKNYLCYNYCLQEYLAGKIKGDIFFNNLLDLNFTLEEAKLELVERYEERAKPWVLRSQVKSS